MIKGTVKWILHYCTLDGYQVVHYYHGCVKFEFSDNNTIINEKQY